MFSAKRKQQKTVPSWKLALEAEAGATSSAPAPAAATSDDHDSRKAPSAPASAAAPAAAPAAADDDDDDDFDPSAYDIGAASEEEEAPAPAAAGDEPDASVGVLYAAPHTNAGACMKRQRFQDNDGRDTLCINSRGAKEDAVQALVGTLPGYRATRFVNSGMVFILFGDSDFAHQAFAALQGKTVIDANGKTQNIRVEWAKRSLRPH